MADFGIFIAKPGTIISDNSFDFDSRRKHLLVDLDANPKHFDVLSITGTAIHSTGSGNTATENLLQIAHGLPYIPKIETYIFDSGNFNLYAGSGSYYRGRYYYNSLYGPAVTDTIYGFVDATYYYIKHDFTVAAAGGGNSTAPSYPLKIKYYIFSNKGSY